MKKLDSVDFWLLKSAVECKMKSLNDIMREKRSYSESIMRLYDDYTELQTKLSVMETEYKNELFSK